MAADPDWQGPGLEDILGGLGHAVLLAGLDGVIGRANPQAEQMLGWEGEGLAGRHLRELFLPDDLEYLLPNLLHLAANGQGFAGEMMLRGRRRGGFFARLKMTPLAASDGSGSLAMLDFQDIDRQKSLERLVGQSNYDHLYAIANSIAHELRNPLAGIGGFVGRLYKSCRISMNHDQYYAYIIDNLQRIEQLVRKVNDLVTMAPPQFSEEPLQGLLAQALQLKDQDIARQGVRVSNQAQDARLRVDRQLMVKGFAILIENALDFVKPGGNIFIGGGPGQGVCRISFQDDGPGIAAQDLPYIFNPFFSTRATGMGMDLAVLNRIVEAHGGGVQASSPPGQGAVFQVELPLERRRSIRTSRLSGQPLGVG